MRGTAEQPEMTIDRASRGDRIKNKKADQKTGLPFLKIFFERMFTTGLKMNE
ncbi:MAG: hypothetical protein HZB81_00395 [Deltaproteobacteria bacterium]|nr:hypothetical protein [Deltaproteobacteria bacterium]